MEWFSLVLGTNDLPPSCCLPTSLQPAPTHCQLKSQFQKGEKLSSFELNFLRRESCDLFMNTLEWVNQVVVKECVGWMKREGMGCEPFSESGRPLLPPSPSTKSPDAQGLPLLSFWPFPISSQPWFAPVSIKWIETSFYYRPSGQGELGVRHQCLCLIPPLARLALPCIRRQSQVPFYTSSSPPAHHREVGELW